MMEAVERRFGGTVPTWGDLAELHGGEKVIGLAYDGEPALFVQSQTLVDAELAAHDESPEDCLFFHPGMKEKEELARERARLRDEERRNERKWVRERLLEADIPPAGMAVIAEEMMDEVFDYFDEEESTAAAAYLRRHKGNPFEGLARMFLAERLDNLTDERLLHVATEGLAMEERELPATAAMRDSFAAGDYDEE
jgi:hypothetical protein